MAAEGKRLASQTYATKNEKKIEGKYINVNVSFCRIPKTNFNNFTPISCHDIDVNVKLTMQFTDISVCSECIQAS